MIFIPDQECTLFSGLSGTKIHFPRNEINIEKFISSRDSQNSNKLVDNSTQNADLILLLNYDSGQLFTSKTCLNWEFRFFLPLICILPKIRANLETFSRARVWAWIEPNPNFEVEPNQNSNSKFEKFDETEPNWNSKIF